MTSLEALYQTSRSSLWSHTRLYTSFFFDVYNWWSSPLRTQLESQSKWLYNYTALCPVLHLSECSKNQKISHAYWSLYSWTLGGCLHLSREQLICEQAILFLWERKHFSEVVGVYPAPVQRFDRDLVIWWMGGCKLCTCKGSLPCSLKKDSVL